MKKRWTLLLAMLVLVASCFAFTACGDGEGDAGSDGVPQVRGTVSDSEWQETLSFNYEAAESCTVLIARTPTYSREEAATYGEYDSFESKYNVDSKNNVILLETTTVTYDATTATFETDVDRWWYFAQGGKYYKVYDSNFAVETDETTQKLVCSDSNLASFIEQKELALNLQAMMSIYSEPMFKQVFTYNSETKTYELAQFGTYTLGIQFLKDNGVTLISRPTSITEVRESVYGINKTTLTLPADVIACVNQFEADKAAA